MLFQFVDQRNNGIKNCWISAIDWGWIASTNNFCVAGIKNYPLGFSATKVDADAQKICRALGIEAAGDLSVSGMIVNRFKIFRFDAIRFDTFVFIKISCNIPH